MNLRLPPFQLDTSQKKVTWALLKNSSAIALVIIGALFISRLYGGKGLERWIWFVLFGTIGLYGIWRQTRRQVDEDMTVQEMLAANRIIQDELPVEFRFITNNTTLQEVIDKVGPYSRTVVKDNMVTYEYDLPYHAAVIVFPESPYQPDDKIRAVYFRKPREDDDSMAL